MKTMPFFALFSLALVCNKTVADPLSYTDADIRIYIEEHQHRAKDKMKSHAIPASITLAQGILESAAGTSYLAVKANNHFGIKCGGNWTGEYVERKDDEAGLSCFRKYNSVDASYADHGAFLQRDRYKSLFTLDIKDYKGWAQGLYRCGYATSQQYPQLLISIVERFDLSRFDTVQDWIVSNKPDNKPATKPSTQPNNHLADYDLLDSRFGLKGMRARKDDTPATIALRLGFRPAELAKYNDINLNYRFAEGEFVYLEEKRAKGHGNVTHHILQGQETMRDVAQRYGIKLEKLLALNGLKHGMEPAAGQRISLKKKAAKPQLRRA